MKMTQMTSWEALHARPLKLYLSELLDKPHRYILC